MGEPVHTEASDSAGSVVVTGAAGFVGSHLTEALLRNNTIVLGIDRRHPDRNGTARENLNTASGDRRFRCVDADLATMNTDDLVGYLDRAEVVFHLAAESGLRDSWAGGFEGHLRSNIFGTQRLLEACGAAGVRRVVIASSSSVYGNSHGRPSVETDPTEPASPYAASKVAAEGLARAYANRSDLGLSVVALRYFTVFGPRQRPDMMIHRVLSAAADGPPVTVFGEGLQERDFTYIDDAVNATIAAAQVPAHFELINVGGGQPVSLRDLIRVAEAVTGRGVPLRLGGHQQGDVDVTHADLTKAERLLRYKPGVDLANGLLRHWDWLVRQT